MHSGVYIAVPAYGPAHPSTRVSAFDIGRYFGANGIPCDIGQEEQDANQYRARNALWSRYLETRLGFLLCLDNDTICTARDVDALLDADVDIVGAMCKPRVPSSDFVGEPLAGGEVRDGLVEMARIGLGMTLISRRAVERLTAAASRSFVHRTGACAGKRVAEVFRPDIRDDEYVTCDYQLSEQWRALGGRLWRHSGVRVGHAGQHIFR